MLNWVLVSNPDKPGSILVALVQDKKAEQTLRNNAVQQNLICGPTHTIEPTNDFWRFKDFINRK